MLKTTIVKLSDEARSKGRSTLSLMEVLELLPHNGPSLGIETKNEDSAETIEPFPEHRGIREGNHGRIMIIIGN